MLLNNCGLVYVAESAQCLAEAIKSLSSVRKFLPHIKATIFTNRKTPQKLFNRTYELPDHTKKGWDWRIKIAAISACPYEFNLFLDSDTLILADISELFLLLHGYDLAISHAPIRQSATFTDDPVPSCFPGFNTGVILYRRCEATYNLFSAWEQCLLDIRNAHPEAHDQPAFRQALYTSDVRFITLTSEWNCRFNQGGYVHEKVKILHTRRNPEVAAHCINRELGRRVYLLSRVIREGLLLEALEALSREVIKDETVRPRKTT